MGAAMIGVVMLLIAFLLLMLAPGMMVNLLIDRFTDDPDQFLVRSFGDKPTWLISALFWLGVGAWGYRRVKVWQSHQQ